MISGLTKLSEHLTCVALSELPFRDAVSCQKKALESFGPVTAVTLPSWSAGLNYLQPLRSFPRRYLVAECGKWSLVLCDMLGEWCHPDILFHSKLTGCTAVAGIAVANERRFTFIRRGVVVRDIHSFHEKKWETRSEGAPLEIESEDPQERLSVSAVTAYLMQITDTPFPLTANTLVGQLVGLERSWHEVRAEPKEFRIVDDVGELKGQN